MKHELRDAHPRIELYGDRADIGKLERDLAFEAGIDETGGGVNHYCQPTNAASPVDGGDQIRRDRDGFDGRAEAELSGVKHEGLALGDPNALAGRDQRLRISGIQARNLTWSIDHELVGQPHVDAGGLDLQLLV